MKTPGLDGIYIGPADLSLAIGEKPSFDKIEADVRPAIPAPTTTILVLDI